MQKRILSISYDQTLLETRQALLEARGYSVTSVRGFAEAIAYCKRKYFDLFVLGHSIPTSDKQELISTFRKHCPAPILSLARMGEERVESDFHASPYEPEQFLKTVETILSQTDPADKTLTKPVE